MMYRLGQTLSKESFEPKHSPLPKEIHRIMMRWLTFEILFSNRHRNFYALETPS